MNANLTKVLRLYSMGSDNFCVSVCEDNSKAALVALLSDLLTLYINDRNSSTLREYLTLLVAGYQHSEGKIGYNGFATTGPGGKTLHCEVKPSNARRADIANGRSKLNGSGSFNDYTWKRLEKDTANDPNILVSGFVDGRLVYILEFPFHALIPKLKAQLEKKLPNGDVPSDYLRGAGFSYIVFRENSEVRLRYRAADFDDFSDCIVRQFFSYLRDMPVEKSGRMS